MQTTAYRLWLDMAAQQFTLMALGLAWTLLGSRKMLVNRAESPAFSAYHPGARAGRFVSWRL